MPGKCSSLSLGDWVTSIRGSITAHFLGINYDHALPVETLVIYVEIQLFENGYQDEVMGIRFE